LCIFAGELRILAGSDAGQSYEKSDFSQFRGKWEGFSRAFQERLCPALQTPHPNDFCVILLESSMKIKDFRGIPT
jgi:hypothetical protein